MINTIALKTVIINLAVSGKLSSKFQVLDSVNKITEALPVISKKRRKLLSKKYEYSKQFTIPKHWKWIRLGEISSYGETPTKAYFDDVSDNTWILDLEDIKVGGEIITKTRVHGKKFLGEKTVFKKGQILYSKLRPYLKKILIADEDGIATPELISFDAFAGIIPQYLVYCLLSSFTYRAIEKRSYGIKMPRVDTSFMINLPIPIPPISEQQFIVDKVQNALKHLDSIDTLQKRYVNDLAILKNKLIDAAIQGKLTKQCPEDGTAEELYQQILTEKQSLIKIKKIKKEKPLPKIQAKEIPFDIPNSWKWVRLGDIGSWHAGATPSRSNKDYYNGNIPWLKTGDLNDAYITDIPEYITDLALKECSVQLNPVGSVLIAMYGATIGKIGIAGIPLTTNQACCACIPYSGIYNRYLFYLLMNMRKVFIYMGIGGAQSNISRNKIIKTIIPLPPLAEQKRIVEKLDEALKIIEQNNISQTKGKQ